jgi:hypothetical protein
VYVVIDSYVENVVLYELCGVAAPLAVVGISFFSSAVPTLVLAQLLGQ